MVHHLTTVAPERGLPPHRVAALGAALAELGFEARQDGSRTVFASSAVEAKLAKAYLRGQGFTDREFRVVLEYVRQWGIM